jgi:ribosomal protein S18 acetylase RimI-like enzyme
MDDPVKLPEGYRSKAASMDDAEAATALIAAGELDADGMVEVEVEDVRSLWSRPSFDPARDALLVVRGDEPAAWAMVDQGRRFDADVHPAHRGLGIGAALLDWVEERARAAGASRVGQTFTDANTGAIELFRSRGYFPLWESWILQISLEQELPPPKHPDGITIRAYKPGADDRAAYEVIETAFSEWGDRTPTTFEDWAAAIPHHGSFVPDVSKVALDGERIVGVVIAFDYTVEGWVQQLAVDRAYRGRGIGGELMREAFRGFKARGRTTSGVNTDSRTGALGMYERVGMHLRRTYTRWAKDLN